METYSLFQLHQYIRRVLALNLPDAYWVTAELMQAREHDGHYFLDLVEKEEDGSDRILAQVSAHLWRSDCRRLRFQQGLAVEEILRPGLQVRLQVKISFDERFGYQLQVIDLDADFAVGQLEQRRRQTIAALREEGLLETNGRLALPTVVQRIALITSDTAAGYEDFRATLESNPRGFRFDLHLFRSLVQGAQAAAQVRRHLQTIGRRADRYDAVVIVRGGGARLDLIAFDDEQLCRTAAACPLPVITGIGHEVDETVLDLVAHTSLKTPTAVADFLLDRMQYVDDALDSLHARLGDISHQHLDSRRSQLQQAAQALSWAAGRQLERQGRQLQDLARQLPGLALRGLADNRRQLDQYERLLTALDPQTTLQRGYSLLARPGGELISDGRELEEGEEFRIRTREGEFGARKI